MALIRCRHLVVGGAYSGLNVHGHRIHPLAKRRGGEGGAEKNMALWGRGGGLLSGGPEFSEGQGGAKFLVEARVSRAAMFFCKRVISVATLL